MHSAQWAKNKSDESGMQNYNGFVNKLCFRPKPCPAIMEFTGYMHVPDKSAVSDKLSVNESKERRHYDGGRVQKSTILAER